jgi:ribose transport system substrate-binding protein
MFRSTRWAALGAVLALAATSCSSGSKATVAAETTAPAVVETTASAETTPPAVVETTVATVETKPADTVAAAGASDEVAKAKAAIEPFMKPPTDIKQTTPLSGPVPKDKLYVFLQCELPQCVEIGNGAIEAAKAIGWKTKIINWSTADLQTMLTAMDEAIALKPVAITTTGIPQDFWAEKIPAAEAAGAMIIPIAVADLKTSKTVPMGAAMGSDYKADGMLTGNWFIADSNAEGKALVVDVPAYPVLTAHGIGFKETVAAGCKKCTTTTIEITVPQLGAGEYVPTVVSALQKDPSIKYVITTNGGFIDGLTAAIDAAGIKGVKIAGGSATINNLAALEAGTEHAWAGEAIHIAARQLLGMDTPDSGGGRTQQLFVKGNVGTPTLSLDKPDDFRDRFMKLWGV